MRQNKPSSERLPEIIQAITQLLQLAERLRRTNFTKWDLNTEQWSTAVQAVLSCTDGMAGQAIEMTDSIRLARGVIRRLNNSAEARLASLIKLRHPDSSDSGSRFYADLESAHQRLSELKELDGTG